MLVPFESVAVPLFYLFNDQRNTLYIQALPFIANAFSVYQFHTFFRSIETIGADRIPADRPVLLLANHGNGFVDPIVIAAALGRLPRFIAKAAMWKVLPARFLLDGVGALPVYRHADGDRTADNESVFAACHRALADGGTVAMFPEGTTGNRATLDRIRSGAARIAIGALPTAPDLAVVPVARLVMKGDANSHV